MTEPRPPDPLLSSDVVRASPDAMLVYEMVRDRLGRTAAFRQRLANPAAQALLADPCAAELRGLLPDTATEDVFAEYVAVATTGSTWSFDKTLRDAGGAVALSLGVEVRPVDRASILVRMTDETQRLRASARWEQEAARLRLLARRSRDVLLLVDPRGSVLYASEGCAAVLGKGPDEVVGGQMVELFDEEHRPGLFAEDGGLRRSGSLRGRSVDDADTWFEVHFEEHGVNRGVILHDVSRIRRMEIELQDRHGVTSLPGVVSKEAFGKQLVQEVARRQRYGRTVSVAAIALDHRTALRRDGVLEESHRVLAGCFEQVLRVADLVGAWTDDVFVVLLPETSTEGAVRACVRINECLANQRIAGTQRVLSVSAGISAVDYGDVPKVCLKRALVGLGTNRRAGPGTVRVSDTKQAA